MGFREDRLPGPFLWYGGKGSYMLPRIINLLPITHTYCEPYLGAGSIFFTKKRSPVEVINDLDHRIVNFMRVLKDPNKFNELYSRIFFTPYSREEFITSLLIIKGEVDGLTDVEKAWGFFTAQNQGYGGISWSPGHWGRAFTYDTTYDPVGVAKKVSTYALRIDRLPRQHERVQNVVIKSTSALEIIKQYDGPDTCMYLDPPYIPDTRVNKKVYFIDQPESHHNELVELLLKTQGAYVLSGYDHPVYLPLEDAGWERIDMKGYSSASARNRGTKTVGKGSLLEHVPRIEVVWRSPLAVELKPR